MQNDSQTADIVGRRSSQSSSNSDELRAAVQSNADYDHIRNTTLMFFLDRLFISSKEGQEVRTLHDLSCLFGTRGFTKEMRQIVGASRNGLKKFLQSYPSLFTVDGDQVYLTQLKQEAGGSAGGRDYNREAVEYFTQKLLQFGASLVPIRNLFGYRSQASQEVRHVSGKSTKEFRQFLQAHQDVFEILDDEHVMLKSAMKELEEQGETHESLQMSLKSLVGANSEEVESSPVVMDSYLNKQFARFIEDLMRRSVDTNKVTVRGLHEQILSQCQNQLFLKMVRSVEELRVFLRMHPKIFKRLDGDLVCLVGDEERREMERQAYPSLHQQQQLQKQKSAAPETASEESSLSSQPVSSFSSLPPQASHQSQQQKENQEQPMSLMVTANSRPASNSKQPTPAVPTSGQLRATAPPFVPSIHLNLQRQSSFQQQQQPTSLVAAASKPTFNNFNQNRLQRSVSNLTSTSITGTGNQRPSKDPRTTLRSYLIKANMSNQGSGLYAPQKMSNGGHQAPFTRQNSNFGQQQSIDSSRARTVNIVREASSIITRVMNSSDAVAFDCKGYNLGFNGQITLIQFAFLPNNNNNNNNNNENSQKQKPEVCIFDMITNEELAYCLKPLLESEKIVKVVHDVRNKSNALYNQFGIMLKHVFDTQVANLVIQQQETGKPAYKSRYISMSKLCEIYGDEHLMKYRNSIKSKTRHATSGPMNSNSSRLKDVNYWRARPLTDAMVYESTMDVYCLVGGVYQNLKSKIKPEYEPLFEELNMEGVLARIKPDEIRSVKKERKIDLEVIDLKRKLYNDTTRSIVLSNREIRLLRHVDLTEEVRQKIQQCKKVAKKLERLDMKAAQNAQLLQSMTQSQNGSSISDQGDTSLMITNNDLSLNCGDNSLQTNGINETSSESGQQKDVNALLGLNIDDNEITGMTNLMDSSMFDELKDKMIESSSLLESLEDDDEDEAEHHHHSHDSNCTCLCHHSTGSGIGNNGVKQTTNSQTTTNSSVEVMETSATKIESDQEDASVESRAVDMAVQCDLLS